MVSVSSSRLLLDSTVGSCHESARKDFTPIFKVPLVVHSFPGNQSLTPVPETVKLRQRRKKKRYSQFFLLLFQKPKKSERDMKTAVKMKRKMENHDPVRDKKRDESLL